MKLRETPLLALLTLTFALLPSSAPAALDAADTTWDGSEPPPGVYFYWYEPSFYTGFAPRTEEPDRLHIHLGRGNQVRVTLVLGDRDLDAYLDDLVLRRKTYQELIDAKVIELSTNREYERFVQKLDEAGVGETAKSHDRQKAVDVMSTLNPRRVFRIHVPVDQVAARWHARLTGTSPEDLTSTGKKLDAANAVLPGRVNLSELGPELEASLARAVELAHRERPESKAFRDETADFLQKATAGRYPVHDQFVDAVEFTAIYPAATVDATTTYKGERLPDFGVKGIWPLIRRMQGRGITGMVDYLSSNPGYGFITMLAYQHAGGITYNAFHNAGVRSQLNSTAFLPGEWRRVMGERDPKKAYQNLWIVSRGPTSHGCIRLPSGAMSELRQIVPTTSETLERVRTFRNLPGCYDVFDVQGDGTPEVVGVQYYLAYKCDTEHTPIRSYVSNRREPFYRWLYGANVNLGDVGHVTLKEVPVCRFVGRKAEEAQILADMALYEAPFERESIQFYRVKPVPFDSERGFELNRELRKVGSRHPPDHSKLFLK